ncbi:MAG: hypothetical protein CMJ83_04675 [Planctomycetes bacterium]|nr:hypothetical protein [Planctomycetota bacterium]
MAHRRPFVTFAFCALCTLLLTACPDDGPSDDAKEDPVVRMKAVGERLEKIVRRPWLSTDPILKPPLIELHNRFVQLSYAATPNEDIEEKSAELLADFDRRYKATLERLELVDGTAHRVWEVENLIERMLETIAIPEDAPFPLRSRYKTGWRKDKHEWFRFVVEGIVAGTQGKDTGKFLIGTKNLERVAKQGVELYDEINRLGRSVGLIDHKIRNLEKRIPWAGAVAKKAKEKGGFEAKTLDQIEAARQTAIKELPALRDTWKKLRAPFVLDAKNEHDAHQQLMNQLDLLMAGINRPAVMVARSLDMLD